MTRCIYTSQIQRQAINCLLFCLFRCLLLCVSFFVSFSVSFSVFLYILSPYIYCLLACAVSLCILSPYISIYPVSLYILSPYTYCLLLHTVSLCILSLAWGYFMCCLCKKRRQLNLFIYLFIYFIYSLVSCFCLDWGVSSGGLHPQSAAY